MRDTKNPQSCDDGWKEKLLKFRLSGELVDRLNKGPASSGVFYCGCNCWLALLQGDGAGVGCDFETVCYDKRQVGDSSEYIPSMYIAAGGVGFAGRDGQGERVIV